MGLKNKGIKKLGRDGFKKYRKEKLGWMGLKN